MKIIMIFKHIEKKHKCCDINIYKLCDMTATSTAIWLPHKKYQLLWDCQTKS